MNQHSDMKYMHTSSLTRDKTRCPEVYASSSGIQQLLRMFYGYLLEYVKVSNSVQFGK